MSDAHSYKGVVRGGPLDGEVIVNNARKGFVAVNLETNKVWVHDFNSNLLFKDEFNAREAEELDPEKLEKAQEDGGRSVMVISGDYDG